jgi:hypothetical protein
MLDADLQRFEAGINQTKSGMRLRMAVHEARIAVRQIERLQALNNPRYGRAIESWRQAYIHSCEHAAQAIDELWDQHQWPTDGARERRFEWRPTKDVR